MMRSMKGKVPSRTKPVTMWREKEILNGEPVNALVAILRSRGCYWASESGCLMCGYSCDTIQGITDDDILTQFGVVMDFHEDEDYIKIYNSGSFFDNREMSDDTRDKMLIMAGGDGQRHVLVESRPEFIKPGTIDRALEHVGSLEVAIGLETANDEIRKKCVNKGFSFEDFKRAASILRDKGVLVRTYILLKPPYLTEREAIEDAVESARLADEHSDIISFNPINVQRGTMVEKMWRKGLYRPPWLWSLAEVLKRAKAETNTNTNTNTRLISSPSGGGSRRGVHNCPQCNKRFLEAIDKFYLDQDPSQLEFSCTCKAQWMDTLEFQGMMGTTADLDRLIGEW